MRVVATLALALAAGGEARTASAESAPCVRGAHHLGPVIDLDVKDADLHNLFRFLADAGNVNTALVSASSQCAMLCAWTTAGGD